MALRISANVRPLGNGACVPVSIRDLKAEGIKMGDPVEVIVMRRRPLPASAFGSLRHLLKGKDLQASADEDRKDEEDD